MRVLHVYTGNLYGGIERFLVTLAQHQGAADGVQHEFALCFEGRLAHELEQASACVHWIGPVRASRPMTVARGCGRLRSLLNHEHPDAVVCHSVWCQGLFGPVVRSTGLPLIFWLHDAVNRWRWEECAARLVRPDLSITNSRFTLGSLLRLYPGVRSEIVRYPVALATPNTERRAVRNTLGATDGIVAIVQVSRLEPWKGHALLLAALGRIRHSSVWACWIAGGAQRPHELKYLEELQRLAARLDIADRVRFLGERSDVPELLNAADIHCQPNLGPEPFGIAFIEALRASLPVITTAQGAAPEIVDSSCGILTAPNDAEQLADALRVLIEDASLRARMGAGGPARAHELCDPDTQVAQLAGVLRTTTNIHAAA